MPYVKVRGPAHRYSAPRAQRSYAAAPAGVMEWVSSYGHELGAAPAAHQQVSRLAPSGVGAAPAAHQQVSRLAPIGLRPKRTQEPEENSEQPRRSMPPSNRKPTGLWRSLLS